MCRWWIKQMEEQRVPWRGRTEVTIIAVPPWCALTTCGWMCRMLSVHTQSQTASRQTPLASDGDQQRWRVSAVPQIHHRGHIYHLVALGRDGRQDSAAWMLFLQCCQTAFLEKWCWPRTRKRCCWCCSQLVAACKSGSAARRNATHRLGLIK